MSMTTRFSGALATLLLAATPAVAQTADLAKVETILVIYAENRSFDHLYGLFPGANGIADATPEQYTQRDHDGSVLPDLQIWGHDGKPDPKMPRMPNAPFRIDQPPIDGSTTKILPSPIHAYYHNIEQINGGRNDRFVAMSNVGGWVMGYFDGSSMKLWQWAKDYTLADNFFMGAFGGSYLNHQWLVCACTPVFKNAPEAMYAHLDKDARERCASAAAAAGKSRRTAIRSTPRSRPTSRAAFRRPSTGRSTSSIRKARNGAARRCRRKTPGRSATRCRPRT
jgi:acid phosphatase